MITVNLWTGLAHSHVRLNRSSISAFDCFKHLKSADPITLWVFGPFGILLHAEVSGSASSAVEALIGWFIHQGWQRPMLGFSGATDSPKCFSGAILNHPVGVEEGWKRAKLQKTDVAATSATDSFNVGLNRTQSGEKKQFIVCHNYSFMRTFVL